MSNPAIRLEDVHLRLGSGRAQVHVLRGISLQVETGQSVAILGPSGSGKSSLLMVMAGLEPPSSGRAELAGRDIAAMGEDELAAFRGATAGIVFQSFHLIPTMTALENVSIPLELARANGRDTGGDIRAAAKRELEAVGPWRAYRSLPGGAVRGRAAARRAGARGGRAAADPVRRRARPGNLDGATGSQIIDLLLSARDRRTATLVLVTHDEALAHRCNRIIRMADGHIVSDSASRDAVGIAAAS